MKKFIAVAMIALLAVTSVFAGISGSVSTSAGYNLDTKEYGFFGTNLANAKLKFALGNESAATEAADASVYATIAANFDLYAKLDKNVVNAEGKGLIPGYDFKITEAKIGGADWYIDLLGMGGTPDFAASFLDLNGDGQPDANRKLDFRATNGLKASYKDYVVGFGFNGKGNNMPSMAAYVVTPEYAPVEGLTLQGAVAYSHSEKTTTKAATQQTWYYNTALPEPIMLGDNAVAVTPDKHNVGTSFKLGYAKDEISANFATDLVFEGLAASELTFDFDIAADFAYDFVSVNAYYGYDKKADLGVDVDLNSFDVPVTLGVTLLDVATDARALSTYVGFEGYGATATVYADVDLKKAPGWAVGFEGSYAIEDVATIAGSVGYDSDELLSASLSVENETLIPGAKLAFGWYGASDLLQKDNTKEQVLVWKDLEHAPTAEDFKNLKGLDDFGVIKASVTVEF